MAGHYGEFTANNYARKVITTSTTSVEATTTSGPIKDRKFLKLWNAVGSPVFYSTDSTLSGSNILTIADGVIAEDEDAVLPLSPNVHIYVCNQTGKDISNLHILELS